MEHAIGYLASGINLLSMTMQNMIMLRILSLSANLLFVLYGLQMKLYPILISCTLAACIHTFQLYRVWTASSTPPLDTSPHT